MASPHQNFDVANLTDVNMCVNITGTSFEFGNLAPYTGEVIEKLAGRIASEISAEFDSRIEAVSDRRLDSVLSSGLKSVLEQRFQDDGWINRVFKPHLLGGALEDRIDDVLHVEVGQRLDGGLLDQRLGTIVGERLNDTVLTQHIDAVLRRRLDALVMRRLDAVLNQYVDGALKQRLNENSVERRLNKAIAKRLEINFERRIAAAMDRCIKVDVTEARIDDALQRRVGGDAILERVDHHLRLRLENEVLEKRVDHHVRVRLEDDALEKRVDAAVEANVKKRVESMFKDHVTDNLVERSLESLLKKHLESDVMEKRFEAVLGQRLCKLLGIDDPGNEHTSQEESVVVNTKRPVVRVTPKSSNDNSSVKPASHVKNFHYPSFDPDKMRWSIYELGLDVELSKAGITLDIDKKWALLLNLNKETVGSLVSHLSPRIVIDDDVTYNDIVTFFRMKYNDPLLYCSLLDFRHQEQGERSVNEWVRELWHLSTKCQFGSRAEEEIKMQVIRGCKYKTRLQEDVSSSMSLDDIVELLRKLERRFNERSEHRQRTFPHRVHYKRSYRR